jgi:hypothetical protein
LAIKKVYPLAITTVEAQPLPYNEINLALVPTPELQHYMMQIMAEVNDHHTRLGHSYADLHQRHAAIEAQRATLAAAIDIAYSTVSVAKSSTETPLPVRIHLLLGGCTHIKALSN